MQAVKIKTYANIDYQLNLHYTEEYNKGYS